jgi:hypothetical protein
MSTANDEGEEKYKHPVQMPEPVIESDQALPEADSPEKARGVRKPVQRDVDDLGSKIERGFI